MKQLVEHRNFRSSKRKAAILSKLAEEGSVSRVGTVNATPTALFKGILSRQDQFASIDAVRRVVASNDLKSLVSLVMPGGGAAEPIEFKWLRAVPRNGFTGLHADRAYFAPQKTCTVWVPLHDMLYSAGLLVVHDGSHQLRPPWDAVHRKYDQMLAKPGHDGTSDRWLDPSHLPAECRDPSQPVHGYRAGDIVLLSDEVFHQTVPNQHDHLRLSCDIRFRVM